MKWQKMKTPGSMVRMKARHGLHTTARASIWSLYVALAMLHPVPGRTLYHCQISGAYLEECCCKVETTCCREKPSCCETDREDRQESLPVDQDTVTADSCGCCDLVYQEGTPPVVRSIENGGPTAGQESALLRRLSSASNVPSAHVSVHAVLSKHRAPPKAPLYLLYSSLLF